jgi:hypothetical protein
VSIILVVLVVVLAILRSVSAVFLCVEVSLLSIVVSPVADVEAINALLSTTVPLARPCLILPVTVIVPELYGASNQRFQVY